MELSFYLIKAGIIIQSYSVLPNSSCEIVLGGVDMETSGLYTCLVTGGDIPFLEDSDSKTVMVASKSWY